MQTVKLLVLAARTIKKRPDPITTPKSTHNYNITGTI
jgi:hypothetical protein